MSRLVVALCFGSGAGVGSPLVVLDDRKVPPARLSRAAKLQAAADCFAAYAGYAEDHDLDSMEARCPGWKYWVSTDGVNVDKIHAAGAAVVLGQLGGNATTGIAGSIPDWGVDLGGGFNNVSVSGGKFVGAHVLSIPAPGHGVINCCGPGDASVASWIAAERTTEVCKLLHDSISGGLAHVGEYKNLPQATAVDDELTRHFSQCFHKAPDVKYLHMHTTAGVTTNDTAGQGLVPYWYNACVCQPPQAGEGSAWPGSCPTAQPSEPDYLPQATTSLCLNVAAASAMPEDVARKVCNACRRAAEGSSPGAAIVSHSSLAGGLISRPPLATWLAAAAVAWSALGR